MGPVAKAAVKTTKVAVTVARHSDEAVDLLTASSKVHDATKATDAALGGANRLAKPGEVFYKTTKEATEAAKKLGFEKTKFKIHNETVFYNKKKKLYISRDVGSGDGNGAHNGGVWKMAKSVKELGSKKTRLGTYDADLNKIGD
ncbi:toxin C-terminal domain-containing protein [Vibrio neptunius]|uniref:toxin C-terminal domain-containing protein n=1 Tax=Vibrio neptunius TaxID=170651 RepID=UPI001C5C9A1B|nr:toxin C-terminal domain-containing protein [Vibrio neptunius]QXX08944.1 toxin C-terminal domain-containing protein [Vibrio neptunius]